MEMSSTATTGTAGEAVAFMTIFDSNHSGEVTMLEAWKIASTNAERVMKEKLKESRLRRDFEAGWFLID